MTRFSRPSAGASSASGVIRERWPRGRLVARQQPGSPRQRVRAGRGHEALRDPVVDVDEAGSAFTVFAQWPVEAFEMSGEISSYDGRGFCPLCGSRLLDTTGADSGGTLVEIRIGSLDDAPFELKPEHEIWVKRRESWIPPLEGAEQHDEG
jgi:hypothetical protein